MGFPISFVPVWKNRCEFYCVLCQACNLYCSYNISLRIMTGHEISIIVPCDLILIFSCHITFKWARRLFNKMSLRNKWFVWFNRDPRGKYLMVSEVVTLMVSEWTSNPRQLINIIIINYWQRKWLEYYQISWKIFNDGHEGHDNLEATWLASRHYG